ncbi:sulfotransferase family protein [Lutibacter oceani]|uniref:Sulfotransferase family protein n=1 Tax=Lutibacter oceani TaxID=1853311 RepID=A0A3D9RUI1_9FLAO|nr:sulfotransferase [Lutibacter oceani]REE80352.1 sulfotransferase family protein [Lutibacter oceani]
MDKISPVLITSPCQRSGTTLLVRLLNSASNSLIYGENAANDIFFLVNQLTHRKLFLSIDKNQRDALLQSMLNGHLNQWIPDLLPNVDDYLESMEKAFLSHIQFFQEYAKKENRNVWGVKQPGWTGGNINVFRGCLPDSKVIYIYRDIEACIKSAKGIQMINSFDEAKMFLQAYLESYNTVMQLPESDKLLKIAFNDIVEKPIEIISKIAAFTGAKGIDQNILKIKVNTYFGDARSPESNDGYISPVELSLDEKNLIKEAKGNMFFHS